VWFTVFYLNMYTGRPDRAIALGLDRPGRPLGIPDADFDKILTAARAIQSGARADIDKAVALNLAAAHEGRGYAENALQIAAFLGRLDTAFAVAEAYYFGRGFAPAPLSFSRSQGQYQPEPRTHLLFYPSTATLRADPRFDRLTAEIGLKGYWQTSGNRPDYLRPLTATD
jgi:hypothetical protein